MKISIIHSLRAGTENTCSIAYFNAILLTKVFCPGSSTNNGQASHLGLAFACSPSMQPSGYEENKGSMQTWLNREGSSDGVLMVEGGHCMNKPAKGECPYNAGHISHHWVVCYPVVWLMDLTINILVILARNEAIKHFAECVL